jgi:hypothetical protein
VLTADNAWWIAIVLAVYLAAWCLLWVAGRDATDRSGGAR